MAGCIVALPMYDWPERRAEVDEQWASLRYRLRAAGVDAPDRLVRRNADMPSVPGGIRDSDGSLVAPDPATLPPDELHLHALWRHPSLLLAQTCWGPMGLGLARHVDVVGQQDYTDVEGGRADFYSSAVVARRTADDVPAPSDGRPHLALDALRGKRLAYNSNDSMSGLLGLERDLNALGEGLGIFSERLESGGHRSSIVAVAEGRADVAAVDCLSWQLAKRFEPAAEALAVIGWTTRRRGLPFIVGRRVSQQTVRSIAVELENSSLTPTSETQKE